MCLAVPAEITHICGQEAQVVIGGVKRHVSLMLTPEARVGNYVVVHAGFAISVLDTEEARETLEWLRNLNAQGPKP